MHTATGTLTAHHNATRPAHYPQRIEIRNHPVLAAALRGAWVGALIGITIFGLLLWLSGAPILAPRYITLYLCGIAMCTAGVAGIAARPLTEEQFPKRAYTRPHCRKLRCYAR